MIRKNLWTTLLQHEWSAFAHCTHILALPFFSPLWVELVYCLNLMYFVKGQLNWIWDKSIFVSELFTVFATFSVCFCETNKDFSCKCNVCCLHAVYLYALQKFLHLLIICNFLHPCACMEWGGLLLMVYSNFCKLYSLRWTQNALRSPYQSHICTSFIFKHCLHAVCITYNQALMVHVNPICLSYLHASCVLLWTRC